MTHYQTLPMDSFDLARYAVQVPCFVCGGGNAFDAERCRHCWAPLALTYQSGGKKSTAPRMLAVIGPPRCGKTTYLSMLTDILSRQQNALPVLARGAFTLALQQQSVDLLARRRFPKQTPPEPEHWNWMHYQVTGSRRRRACEFIMPDMSGAAFATELERKTSVTVQAFLKKCTGALVMVDAEQLERGDQTPDFFGMKVISHLHELATRRKTSWKYRPVAVVFTKADCCPHCLEDPRSYAEIHTPGLFRHCQQRLRKHAFFAASIAGGSVDIAVDGDVVPVALRIEPRGISQPLEWLLSNLH